MAPPSRGGDISVVTSVNGSSGAITNVAKINEPNYYSSAQLPSGNGSVNLGSSEHLWHYGYFKRLLAVESICNSTNYATNKIDLPSKSGVMALISDLDGRVKNATPTCYTFQNYYGAYGTHFSSGVWVKLAKSTSIIDSGSTYSTLFLKCVMGGWGFTSKCCLEMLIGGQYFEGVHYSYFGATPASCSNRVRLYLFKDTNGYHHLYLWLNDWFDFSIIQAQVGLQWEWINEMNSAPTSNMTQIWTTETAN